MNVWKSCENIKTAGASAGLQTNGFAALARPATRFERDLIAIHAFLNRRCVIGFAALIRGPHAAHESFAGSLKRSMRTPAAVPDGGAAPAEFAAKFGAPQSWLTREPTGPLEPASVNSPWNI